MVRPVGYFRSTGEKMKKSYLPLANLLLSMIILACPVFAGVLTVNDSSAGIVCNQTLSLKEAAQFAWDGSAMRNLTDGEKNQISGVTWVALPPDLNCAGAIWRAAVNGGVGKFATDFIFFTNGVNQINDYVLLGRDDRINGLKPNGSKVILDGTGVGNIDGITFMSFDDLIQNTTSSQVAHLIIRNFQRSGISAGYARGSVFEGLEIYGNGSHGIVLLGTAEANPRTVRIGGTQIDQRNLIYGNGLNGISIIASPSTDRALPQNIGILNNYIGTSNGTTDNGNSGNGIYLENTFGVVIGDAAGATRNIISGNNNDGIKIEGSQAYANEVFGNFIGTDSTGGGALGNSASGIALLSAAGSAVDFVSKTPNLIGKPGLGNIISSNNYGIFIADNNTSKNWIQSNLIGTNVGGNSDLGNTLDGILVGGGTSDNRIGGTGTGEGNLIAFNRRGIFADGGERNAFRRNRLFSNDELGIDLAPVGVTANDAGDGDTGPNGLLNYPVITYVNAQNSFVGIEGTFSSSPNQTYTIEFFGNTAIDPTGSGEGRNFLGQTVITTNGVGNANFNVEFAANISNTGTWVTATATDSNNNTSEFSQGRNICSLVRLTPAALLATASGGASSFTVNQSVGCGGYTPVSNSAWVTVTGSAGGTVSFTFAANSGAQRNGTISVNFNNGQFFTFVNFNITQLATGGCAYNMSPTNANIGSAGGPGSFSLSTTAGCTWTAVSNASWLIVTGGSSGTGSGTVSYSVQANTGPARSATITAGGQTFTIDQASGCTYSLNPSSQNLTGSGGNGTFNLTTSNSSCSWTATSNESWINITGGGIGNGNGTVSYTVATNSTGSARTGTITVSGQTFTVNQFGSALKAPFDFDGDGKTDVSIFRPNLGQWWYMRSVDGGNRAFTFGESTDKLAPVDFTGDGKTDIAFWRPSTGEWYVLRSEDSTFYAFPFGAMGDVPVPADYDGDGKGDAAVFRPSTAIWYIARSSGGITIQNFGASTDIPVHGDFDGDAKSDLAIFRPSDGSWWIQRSSNGSTFATIFGTSTDKRVPGDYTGDGKTDLAFWRPSTGQWFILRSEDLSYYSVPFGISSDIPVAGDYDGDGRWDVSVFRPTNNTWYLNRSTSGVATVTFGAAGDKPVPSAWIP